jgi:hypothetical protein
MDDDISDASSITARVQSPCPLSLNAVMACSRRRQEARCLATSIISNGVLHGEFWVVSWSTTRLEISKIEVQRHLGKPQRGKKKKNRKPKTENRKTSMAR